VVALAISLAIYSLIDTTNDTPPFKYELLPFFFSFLVILIPFYHGALRHLDVTYVEQGGMQFRKPALLFDFLALFIESCFFIVLAVLLTQPIYFVWILVGLIAFDTSWGFVIYLCLLRTSGSPKHELRWAIINLVTIIVLTGYLIILGYKWSFTYVRDLKLEVFLPCSLLLRTVIDYWLCWDFYYPSS
jgi:hypothetical protein